MSTSSHRKPPPPGNPPGRSLDRFIEKLFEQLNDIRAGALISRMLMAKICEIVPYTRLHLRIEARFKRELFNRHRLYAKPINGHTEEGQIKLLTDQQGVQEIGGGIKAIGRKERRLSRFCDIIDPNKLPDDGYRHRHLTQRRHLEEAARANRRARWEASRPPPREAKKFS